MKVSTRIDFMVIFRKLFGWLAPNRDKYDILYYYYW